MLKGVDIYISFIPRHYFLSRYTLAIFMHNRIAADLSGFFIFLLSLIFISGAKAVDVDLEPINFTFNPEYPSDGESIDITFEVVNNGNETATNVGIVVWNSTAECDLEDDCVPVFETTETFIDRGKSSFL